MEKEKVVGKVEGEIKQVDDEVKQGIFARKS
jgi:hypothetical protein